MPPAEYKYVGNASADNVLDAAKASAAKIGRRYAVLVTEATRRTWVGLEPIHANGTRQ